MNKTFAFVLSCIMVVIISSCKDPERKKVQFPNYLKNTNWIIESGALIIPDGEKTYYLSLNSMVSKLSSLCRRL